MREWVAEEFTQMYLESGLPHDEVTAALRLQTMLYHPTPLPQGPQPNV